MKLDRCKKSKFKESTDVNHNVCMRILEKKQVMKNFV
jgi:hypothetical protein